jgi:hypothetical protein
LERAALGQAGQAVAGHVHRIWQKYGLQPHRGKTFKFSCDPQFDAKLAGIVGVYLDPPEHALVLCVDEESQIQVLNRTQPALPMWPGLPARMSHVTCATHHQPVRRAGGGQAARSMGVATGTIDTPSSSASWACWPGAIASWSCI